MYNVTRAKVSGLLGLLLSALVTVPASAQTAAYNNDI